MSAVNELQRAGVRARRVVVHLGEMSKSHLAQMRPELREWLERNLERIRKAREVAAEIEGEFIC